MLYCFKDYKRCIHISYHILDCIQQKKPEFTKKQPYMLPTLYCQCHACWCPGSLKSTVASKHGIDQMNQNILSFSIRKVHLLSTGPLGTNLSKIWNNIHAKWFFIEISFDNGTRRHHTSSHGNACGLHGQNTIRLKKKFYNKSCFQYSECLQHVITKAFSSPHKTIKFAFLKFFSESKKHVGS